MYELRVQVTKVIGECTSEPPEALGKFKHINDTHQPEALPKAVLSELERILAAAEREAERSG